MEAPSSPPPLSFTIEVTLDQASIINAALAKYWLHTKNRTELHHITPQVESLQRQFVESIRREGASHHHAIPQRPQEAD
jgi:hypothetical protein